jgi:hypothetical protein
MHARAPLQEIAVSSTKLPINWVSHEMMRERTPGPFQNYGEMLYAESIEGITRRRQRVGLQGMG